MSDVELKTHRDEKVNEGFQISTWDKQGFLFIDPREIWPIIRQ